MTQARSGSRCQKLAWKYCISPRGRGFQTVGSRVSFYFFFPLLSPKPSSPVSQAGRFSSSTLHILAPAAAVFPIPALPTHPKSAEGHVVAQEGTIPARRSGTPGCTSHLQIPESHPCLFPKPIPVRGRRAGGAGPGDAHRHAWNSSVLPERSSPGVNKQPGSSRAGSDASQPRWCQVAPGVPGWGSYQPKLWGKNEHELIQPCQKIPACLHGSIQRSGIGKCFNKDVKTRNCCVKCVNWGDSALVVLVRQHPQHSAAHRAPG